MPDLCNASHTEDYLLYTPTRPQIRHLDSIVVTSFLNTEYTLSQRDKRSTEFLLLNDSYSNKRHWAPPKGKVIGNEDEVKHLLGALSEKPLTSLDFPPRASNITDSSFRIEIKYLSGTTPKHVAYFVASIASKERIIPSGLAGLNMAWLPLAQATEKAMYKNMQDALRQANNYIDLLKTRVPSPMPSSNRYIQGGNTAEKPFHKEIRNEIVPLDGEDSGRGRREGRGIPGSTALSNTARGVLTQPGKPMSMSIGEDGNVVRGPLSLGDKDQKRLVFAPNGSKSWRSGAGEGAYPAPEVEGKDETSQADNPLYKTRLCERYETEGTCPYGGRCTFAHGTTELRDRASFGGEHEQKGDGPENPLYKTRLCERFIKENFCQYGPRCNFAHNPDELRTRPAPLVSVTGAENGGEAWEGAPVQPTVAKVEHHVLNSVPANVVMVGGKKNGKKNDNISLKDLMEGDKYGKKNSRIVEVPVRDISPNMADLSLRDPFQSPSVSPIPSALPTPTLSAPSLPTTPHIPIRYTKVEENLIAELSKYFAAAPAGGRSMTEETKEVTRVEFKHDLTKAQVFSVLIHALFDEEYTAGKLMERKAFLRQYIRTTADQTAFLKAWDKAMQRTAGLMKKAALVFKNLYDADLVEEDVFLRWCEGGGVSEGVKKKCLPLVEWFKTAEEEEEEE
ncbi:eIF4-gamma/eIF5/eIF2-epsilon-domain-containing protein [Chytridium lagenaria]|nr:eIF4-gamma/eIF5/eIF2-epsilon-domain-containing protein [Chytridium lagenaria]